MSILSICMLIVDYLDTAQWTTILENCKLLACFGNRKLCKAKVQPYCY